MKKREQKAYKPRPLMEELEPRLLFSADWAGVFVDPALEGGDGHLSMPAITALLDSDHQAGKTAKQNILSKPGDASTMVDDIAKLTGADVAASTDRNGSAALGGDWELEYHEGDIETGIAFSGDLQREWEGTLATSNITARETVDSDANGQIDRIRITTDQNLNDNFTGLTMTVSGGYVVSGYSSDIANDTIFYVDLTESGSADTDATPTVAVTANTSLSEFGGSNNIAVDGGGGWWDLNWQNRTQITFDNTASSENLTDFPAWSR
jgi:hypothetical protein